MPKKPPIPSPDHILRRSFNCRPYSRLSVSPAIWERMQALTAEAVRQGRVTKCPPAIAAGAYPSFSNDRIELS